MKRRALLGSLATLAVAGCTGTSPGADDADTTRTASTTGPTTRTTTTQLADGVDSRQFSWDSSISSLSKLEDPPSVSFSSDQVTVEGAIRYGSSSCDRIALDDLTYGDGTLDVTVAAASKEDGPKTCTDDIAAGEYTVDVSLSNGLPAEVVVTEDGFESTESHTATPP